MAMLFGREISRSELQSLVGDLSQIAGIRLLELQDGFERGVRIADLRTGSGLRFQVSLERGMDIAMAEFRGIPLAWRSPSGDVHPARYEPEGLGWRRTFPGGLVTGCGLTSAGAPGRDAGEALGLHGRLSHTPAAGVHTRTLWDADECFFELEGTMRESTIFGENLSLSRTIRVALGQSRIEITDRVQNEGFETTPLMMLYHINLGWPLLSRSARLKLAGRSVTPRDKDAAVGLDRWSSFDDPQPGYREQVFYHDLAADEEGCARTALVNEDLGLALALRYRVRELPRFTEWKMTGQSTYVVGLEPANCRVEGRAAERAAGTLRMLAPGEAEVFSLELSVHSGRAAVEALVV
jgi:hypothetical protein